MQKLFLIFCLLLASSGFALDAQKELAELKILVFDSPHQAIARAEKLENDVGGTKAGKVWLEIKALQVLAMTKIEKIDEARAVATKALEQGAWIDDKHSKFSLQLTQIDAGSSLGLVEWEKLAPAFDQLLEGIESSGDDPILARALTSYAAAASSSGRALLATGLMQKVLALLPRLEKDEFYYSILNDLVVTWQQVHEGGDLSTILALAEEVRSFLKERLRRFLGAEIMYNLALAYMSSDNLPKALETMQESLRFADALGDRSVMAYGWLGMGMIQSQSEQYDQAEKSVRDALREFEAAKNQVRVENANYVLIDILLHQSQIEEADRLIQRLATPKSPLNTYKARVLAARGQYEKASQLTFDLWKKNRDDSVQKDTDSTQRMLMEFEASRQEIERLDLEEKEGLRQLKIEQDSKQRQLKIWVLVSIILISCSLIFDFVRVRRKTTEILNMHRRMREQVLSRFLPPDLAQAVAAGQANFDEKPREATVTLLFASIDGIKPGTQAVPIAQEVELLNDVAQVMTQAIHSHGGTLDKTGGGRTMALFGAPLNLDPAESARRSMKSLQAMQEGLQVLNDKWRPILQRPLNLRAALHQGKVIIGSFGCSKRTDFTALGLPVQVADALESTALSGQCLLSETVTPYAKGWTTRDLGSQQIKGLTRPIRVAELALDTATVLKAVLLLIITFFIAPLESRAETRASIVAEHQKAEDMLRDIPAKAQAVLEKIAQDPVLLANPDLRMKQIRLTLEYESRMKIYAQTPQLLEDGAKLVSEVHDPKAEIELLLGKAGYAYELDKIEGVRTSLNRAYELSIKIGDIESQSVILAEQGNLDRSELNYQAALIHYLQAFELVKDRIETDAYAKVANSLALFYLEGLSVRYDQGIKILEDLVKGAEASVKPRRQDLQIFMSNLGYAYSRKGKLDKARQTFERAIQLAIGIEDWTGVAYCQTYIGTVLVKEKKWHEALRYFTLSQNYFARIKNQPMVVRNAQRLMAVQLELGDQKSAAANWKVVQAETEKNLPLDLRVEHSRLRGRLASMEHRWKDAYESFEQMNRLEGKLNAQKNADSARYYTALFNIERKEQDNRRLEQKGRVQVLLLDNNRKQSEVLSWILISASVIALIFAVDFFRVRKRRKKIQDLTENVQKNLLQRYLPHQIVQAVLAGQQNLDSSPQQKRVTLLHAELCDFTRAVELLGPLRIGRILNTYLTDMMDIIGNEGGMIDRFVNGSVLAVFGASDGRSAAEQAEAAVRCARLMQARLEELNKGWQRTEGWVFAVRVGLHQGESLVGMMGVEPRIDYCVVGPVVETASQVCGRGSPGDTMVSASLAPFLDPQNLLSVSRLRPGVDGEVYSLLRASA